MYYVVHSNDYLMHHGILGQKWGIRRYQNEDGSLTPAGVKRYQTNKKFRKRIDAEIAAKEAKRKLDMSNMSDQELQNAVNRMRLEDQYTQMMQARIPKIPPSKMDKIKEYTKEALAKTGNALVDNLSRNIGQGTAKWISDSIFGTGNNKKDGDKKQNDPRLTEETIRKMKLENDAKERQYKADKKKVKEAKKAAWKKKNDAERGFTDDQLAAAFGRRDAEIRSERESVAKMRADRKAEREERWWNEREKKRETKQTKKEARAWEKSNKPTYKPNYSFVSDANKWSNSSASVDAKAFVNSFYQMPTNAIYFDRHNQ